MVEVVPHVAETVPLMASVCEPCVQLMLQPEPVALDVHTMPSAASVPHRHVDTPFSLTVQQAEDDVVLDEHPTGMQRPSEATASSVHTLRMLFLTPVIPRSSPRRPIWLAYGTGSGVTPFCLALSHPSSTPVGPSFVLTILNSTRRFCSHAVSLCPGSSGQNSP